MARGVTNPQGLSLPPPLRLGSGWFILPYETVPGNLHSFFMSAGDSLKSVYGKLDGCAAIIASPPFRNEADPVFCRKVLGPNYKRKPFFGIYNARYMEEILLYMRANARVRNALKAFLALWIKKRLLKEVSETDLVTLEPAQKPVTIYDWLNRRKYTFEARTILIDIQRRFLQHDELFPNPQRPRNPYTNMALSYGQLHSVHEQLLSHGLTHWCLERFRAVNYEFCNFKLLEDRPLKLAALKSVFEQSGEDLHYVLLDFIEYEYDNHGAHFPPGLYKWALVHEPNHTHIQSWKKLCFSHYKLSYIHYGNPSLFQMLNTLVSKKTQGLCVTPHDILIKRRLWMKNNIA